MAKNTELAADDPRHGTTNGYGNLGCRCEACRAAHRASHAAYLARQRAAGRIIGAHGSEVAYETGCRCEPCRTRHNERSREFKRRQRRNRPTATSPGGDVDTAEDLADKP